MAAQTNRISPASMYATEGSAGLDVVAGVFGYLSSLNADSIARSRADMIRAAAEANAQRYGEQAERSNAERKMMYLSSGVTLAGSPIDVLDTQARIASENIASIRMQGAVEASDEEQAGKAALAKGRDALLSGFSQGAGSFSRMALVQSFMNGKGGGGQG